MNLVTSDVVDDKEHIFEVFEVDTLRNDKVIVKNILLHQNFNLKSGCGRRGEKDSYPYTSYSRA
jgi:hypothetical protein